MSWLYLGLMLGALLSGLVVNWLFKLRVWSYWRGLLFGSITVLVPFIVWDIYATEYGHWSFNSDYITGNYFVNLPLEEVLFFIAVPFVMFVLWLLVGKYTSDKSVWLPRRLFIAVGTASLLLAALFSDQSYSFIVFTLFGIVIMLLSFTKLLYKRQFWVYQVVLYGLFLAVNGVLTSQPIVEYSEAAITGLRMGSIPIEDFFYNFVLINGFNYAVLQHEKQL